MTGAVDSQPRGTLYRYLLGHVLALLVAVWPIWNVSMLPLVDYTNHLARMHVLHSYAESPALQENYVVQWALLPYLAMDAVVLPLLEITDIYTAARIFVLVAFLLTAVGVTGLQWTATKRIGPASFLVYPVLYSTNLGWGFVPFVFGIGLALCLLIGVLALQGRHYVVRLGYLAFAFTLMYLCHLLTMGIFALLVACVVTAETRWFSRDFFARGLEVTPAFIPSVLLFTQVPPFPGGVAVTEGWFNPVKLIPLAFNADYSMALVAMIPIATVLYIGWRERFLAVGSPAMWRCLLVTGGVALVMPERLFNVGLVGLRLPYVWLLLLAAGVEFRSSHVRKEAMYALYVVFVAFFGFRHVTIANALGTCDAKLVEFREATQKLPEGTSLMSIYSLQDVEPCGNNHWVEHVNTIAIIERDVFVPNLFVKINPVSPTPERDDPGYNVILPTRIESFFPGDPGYEATPRKMREWRQNFAYISYFHSEEMVPIPNTTTIHSGSWFSILRVEPGDP